jgi:hypothetical protein
MKNRTDVITVILLCIASVPAAAINVVSASSPETVVLTSVVSSAASATEFGAEDPLVDAHGLLDHFQNQFAAGKLGVFPSQWVRDVPVRIVPGLGSDELPKPDRAYWLEYADCHQNVQHRFQYRHPRTFDPRSREKAFTDDTIAIPTTCVDEDGNVSFALRVVAHEVYAYGEEGPTTDFQTLSFNVELVDSVDEIMTPVDDASITAILKEHFTCRAGIWTDGYVHMTVRMSTDLPLDITLGMKVELIDASDGSVLGSASFCINERQRKYFARWRDIFDKEYVPIRVITDISADQIADQAQNLTLQARVSGNPEYALHDISSDAYWSGMFTVDAIWHPLGPNE